jgi:hypothetical protein
MRRELLARQLPNPERVKANLRSLGEQSGGLSGGDIHQKVRVGPLPLQGVPRPIPPPGARSSRERIDSHASSPRYRNTSKLPPLFLTTSARAGSTSRAVLRT